MGTDIRHLTRVVLYLKNQILTTWSHSIYCASIVFNIV